jgi:hypothetical protein
MAASYSVSQSLFKDQDARYIKALKISDDKDFLNAALKLIEDQSLPKFGGERGEIFWKTNRKGQMKKTSVFLSHAHDWVCWFQTGILGSMKKQVRNLDIRHIVRVEEGQNSSNFVKANQLTPMTEEAKNRSFSLIAHDRTISLVARSVNVCKTWARALTILLDMSRNVGVDYYIGRNGFSMYLQEQWNRADTDRSGVIDSDELFEVMRKMNINLNKSLVKKMIAKHKVDNSVAGLNLEEFTRVFKQLFSDRPEVVDIFSDIEKMPRETAKGRRASAEIVKGERLTVEDFRFFHNMFQRSEDEPEMTLSQAQEEIRAYSEDEELGVLEFAQYLDDDKNSIFDPQRRAAGAGSPVDKCTPPTSLAPLSHSLRLLFFFYPHVQSFSTSLTPLSVLV